MPVVTRRGDPATIPSGDRCRTWNFIPRADVVKFVAPDFADLTIGFGRVSDDLYVALNG
jgi:hypothetical protein